jgi:uncharacterized protein (TIGR04255 family)
MVEFNRLEQAPLVYALCEIRFPAVLKMAGFVPDIQERLRRQYENFDRETLRGFQFAPAGPPVALEEQMRWRFEARDHRSGYLLSINSLIFHATTYVDFDHFIPEVMRGFDAVVDIAQISRVQRVGLRYVDLITGSADAAVERFVEPQLLGFNAGLSDVQEEVAQQLLRVKTSIGRLVFKISRGPHSNPLPGDLLPLTLAAARTPDPTRVSIFFDTDHYAENLDLPAETKAVEAVIRQLKIPIARAFKNAVTPFAVSQWRAC